MDTEEHLKHLQRSSGGENKTKKETQKATTTNDR